MQFQSYDSQFVNNVVFIVLLPDNSLHTQLYKLSLFIKGNLIKDSVHRSL